MIGLIIPTMIWATPTSAGAVDCATTYLVQSGDSWSWISRATGIYVRPLAAANGLTRDSPLHPGMELCVPAADSSNSPQQVKPASQTTPSVTSEASPTPATTATSDSANRLTAESCEATHEVARMESWSSIASRYRLPLRALLTANRATVDTTVHPGDRLCIPKAAAGAGATAGESSPASPPADEKPAAGTCEAVMRNYQRVMCMDLSDRRAIIGGRNGIRYDFPAVGGYGPIEESARTIPGTFSIGHKQPLTPRRQLRWGMSYGGGCIGDQIVHTVSRATLQSARGTGGCIGLLEADAKTAYDTLQIGDVIVIVA